MNPKLLSRNELLELIDFIRKELTANNSFEGSLIYSWKSIGKTSGEDEFEVQAAIRHGEGQGFVRMVGDIESEQTE